MRVGDPEMKRDNGALYEKGADQERKAEDDQTVGRVTGERSGRGR